MKRLFLWTLALFVIATALTSGVIAFAQALGGDNPLQAYGFEVCDGKPCFMGVMPGMDLTKAQALLQARGVSIPPPESRIEVHIDSGLVAIYPNKDHKIVSEISLELLGEKARNQFPALGNMILQYGQPCRVLAPDYTIVVWYPHSRIVARTVGDRLGLQFKLLSIFMNNKDNCFREDEARWAGFTTLARYRAQ
jgi:hypothetical protein